MHILTEERDSDRDDRVDYVLLMRIDPVFQGREENRLHGVELLEILSVEHQRRSQSC